jgi:anti-anti-sigma regulatory factor
VIEQCSTVTSESALAKAVVAEASSIGRGTVIVQEHIKDGTVAVRSIIPFILTREDTPIYRTTPKKQNSIKVEYPQPGAVVIRLEGSFVDTCCAATEALANSLASAIDGIEFPAVIVNCAGITQSCNDGTVSPLVRLWNHVKKAKGTLRLCNVDEDLTERLDITNFSKLWPIHGSESEALDAALSGRETVAMLSSNL